VFSQAAELFRGIACRRGHGRKVNQG
jgi:hypothetical protein